MQVTEDQHYVPKTYLKNFSDNKGFVRVFDADLPKQVKNRPYAGICYEDFFYGAETGKEDDLSQIVELFLQQIENDVGGKWLNKIVNKIESTERLTEKDIGGLSLLVSSLWLRSPYMRKEIKLNNDNLLKQLEEWQPEYDFTGEKEYTESNVPHIKMIFDAYKYANLLRVKKWTFHILKTDTQFMTSDSPVSELNPARTHLLSQSILLRKHYLSLTPRILIEISPEKRLEDFKFTKAKRKTYFDNQNDFVKKYNLYLINHCHKYAYSQDQQSLDEVVEKIEIAKQTGKSFYEMSY